MPQSDPLNVWTISYRSKGMHNIQRQTPEYPFLVSGGVAQMCKTVSLPPNSADRKTLNGYRKQALKFAHLRCSVCRGDSYFQANLAVLGIISNAVLQPTRLLTMTCGRKADNWGGLIHLSAEQSSKTCACSSARSRRLVQ
eukprot:6028817-Amphidinium_carterae.1